MCMDRLVVKDSALQQRFDKDQMADWVNFLAPWDVISHLTFRWEASLESGRKSYEKFMRKHLPRVSYFYALEENPSRDGFHVHSLWSDAQGVYRKEAWAKWFKKYGRARIEPVKSQNDVAGYCSKYCTKACAWWNVKLQWHHTQRINGTPFALTADTDLSFMRDLHLGGSAAVQVGVTHAATSNAVDGSPESLPRVISGPDRHQGQTATNIHQARALFRADPNCPGCFIRQPATP